MTLAWAEHDLLLCLHGTMSCRLNRISFSCLLPASWHFSLSSQVIPRLLAPFPRQLLLIGLVLCLMGLLYLLTVTGTGPGGWVRRDHFHR